MEDGVVGGFWTKLAHEPMFFIFRSYEVKAATLERNWAIVSRQSPQLMLTAHRSMSLAGDLVLGIMVEFTET